MFSDRCQGTRASHPDPNDDQRRHQPAGAAVLLAPSATQTSPSACLARPRSISRRYPILLASAPTANVMSPYASLILSYATRWARVPGA